PAVIGAAIRLNEHAFTLIGVTKPAFRGVRVGAKTDIWLPMSMQAQFGEDLMGNWARWWLSIAARRKTGVTPQQAGAEVDAVYQAARAQRGASKVEERVFVTSFDRGESSLRTQFSTPRVVLMGTVALVLLVASVELENRL